jgi:Uma2 family endonuclease
MATVRKVELLKVEDYLALEEKSDERHEYVDGHIYAMVGGTARHNAITLAVASSLREHLRGGSSRVFMSDMTLRTGSSFYYPDVMVVCAAVDPGSLFQTEPALVVEVLSSSTESKDRLEKLVAYQRVASLKEYALLAQDKVRADVYRRLGEGWQLETITSGDALRLESVKFSVPLEKLYDDVLGKTE